MSASLRIPMASLRVTDVVRDALLQSGELDGAYLVIDESALVAVRDRASSPETPPRSYVLFALCGDDLARWEAAGCPMEPPLRAERAAICGACVDQVCAACWRTAVYRWLPTQSCPLGFWPR